MAEEKKYEHWKMGSTNICYLCADLLKPGQEIIATIASVNWEKVVASNGREDTLRVARFVEPNILPLVLNSTNCKNIAKAYNSGNIYDWIGKKIQIFATTTKFAGDIVPCLRVKTTVPTTSVPEYKCAVCGKVIDQKLYNQTMGKYGKAYCSKECVDKDMEGK